MHEPPAAGGRDIVRALSRHSRADLAAAALLLVVGLGVVIGIVAAKSTSATGLLDLGIYRDAARGLRTGTLYDYQDPNFGLGFTYPPFAAVLFAVMGPLPRSALEYAWSVAGASAWLVLLCGLWRRSVRDRAPRWACAFPAATVTGIWLVGLFGAPVWIALNQGQIGIFLWVALTADVVLTVDDRRGAGILTGLAAATKVLPIAAIPLYWIGDRAHAARRAVLGFAAATLLGVILLPSESRRYWGELLWGTRVGERADPRNDSLLGVLARAFGEGRWTTSSALVLGLGVFVLGAISFRAAVRRRAPLSATLALGSTMGLLSPITWTHHLVFLSLLLLFPLMSWREHPAGSAVVLAMTVVVLVDPLGAGNADAALGSSLRALLMIAVLVFNDRLVGLEQPQDVRDSNSPASDGSYPGRR